MTDEASSFPIDLVRCDLQDIIKALDEGTISSVSLIQEYIRRIHADNHAGRELRAILQLAPEDMLVDTAYRLDELRRTNRLSLLHGIPILLKDNIATGPELGLRTTAGTPALLDSMPKRNAPLVDQLLRAGMIILGKANMSVLSGCVHPGMPLGWSPLGGQTQSAFGPGCEVWGSSSGCAVAVSAGMCPAAIGTETHGSLIGPSERAGIVGLRPSKGLINTAGIIPVSQDFDVAGPMAKSAFDIAALLDVLVDDAAPYSSALHFETPLSIGVADTTKWADIAPISNEKLELFEEAVEVLRPLVSARDICVDGHLEFNEDPELSVLDAEMPRMRDDFWQYLDTCGGSIRDLADLVAWQEKHKAVAFHETQTGQDFLHRAVNHDQEKEADHIEVVKKAMKRVALGVEQMIHDKKVDALMYPWGCRVSDLTTCAGFPSCVVPYKLRSDGQPFGVILHQHARPRADIITHCVSYS